MELVLGRYTLNNNVSVGLSSMEYSAEEFFRNVLDVRIITIYECSYHSQKRCGLPGLSTLEIMESGLWSGN